MAPPRQRPTAQLDDSRSETSSISKEQKTTNAPKVRKNAALSTTATNMTAKDMKLAAAATIASISAPTLNLEPDASAESPGIPWNQMPLSILHDYRHAYKLSTPSAYSKSYSKMLLSCGIGLRSPTAIAARRAQLPNARRPKNGSSTRTSQQDQSLLTSEAMERTMSRNTDSSIGRPTADNGLSNNNVSSKTGYIVDLQRRHIHQIIGQGRVSKEQLAMAVRKHFNSAGLMEQEAIARFLYKVREEGKSREFRLRFQP